MFAYLIGLLQSGMLLNIANSRYTARKDYTGQSGLFKAINPACKSGDRPIYRVFVLLCRRSQQVNISEGVISWEQGIRPVQQRFHLATHAVIVNRGSKYQHICRQHLLNNGIRVVMDDATLGVLAAQASFAEPDILVVQRDLFYLIPRILSTLKKMHLTVYLNSHLSEGW